MDIEVFIRRANIKHNNKYDYTKIQIDKVTDKVKIICPKHGDFMQTMSSHLERGECPECSGLLGLNQESFIKKSLEKHKGKYDYSLVEFKGSHCKVKIKCNEHVGRIFMQSPYAHLAANGTAFCLCRYKHTTEGFISAAKQVHGDLYNYDKVVYVKSLSDVEIICPKHGSFHQPPKRHLKGAGCGLCGGTKKKTTSQFVKEAKAKFGNTYDYSEVNYINSKTTVKIKCNIHNVIINQKPSVHLKMKTKGRCLCDSRRDTETFIKGAKERHGGKYDYTKSIYISSKEKVQILCRKHGFFMQTPNCHLKGTGCAKCAFEDQSRRQLIDQEDFLQSIKETHKKRYILDNIIYTGCKNIITPECRIHGLFEITAKQFKRGVGCAKCFGNLKHTKESFIRLANEKHGSLYDYSYMDYIDFHTDVKIVCSKGHTFFQKPKSHTGGTGCPKCRSSRGEKAIALYLEKIGLIFKQQRKFKTCKNLKSLPFDFFIPSHNLLIEYQGKQHFHTTRGDFFGGEAALKKRQARDQIKRDWAKYSPYRLVEIPYTDFNKIEEILEAELAKPVTQEPLNLFAQ